MNAFYERLSHFAELVKDASPNEQHNYARHFKVQHPSYPVVSATRSIVPKLMFNENCPAELRHKIRRMFRKSFNRIRNKV
jgi:hypothetical protein